MDADALGGSRNASLSRRAAADTSHVSFDRFFAAEYRRVVAILLPLAGSVAVGEEIAQDAFLAAFRNWDRIQRYDDPASWVRRVAINRSVSLARRRRRDVSLLLRLRMRRESPEPELPDAEIWREVRKLPRRQAQCVVLRYVDDLPAAEIARVAGMSESTVRVHLHAARRRLAEVIPKEIR